MRRIVAIAVAALVLLAAIPLVTADAASTMRHVDGSITTSESKNDHVWIARFEVRTTPGGDVDFGYLELYGIGGGVKGQIHEFTVEDVTYFKTQAGAPGALFHLTECPILPTGPCVDPTDVYRVTDGASVHQDDTFVDELGWTVDSGNISIYTTSSGQNQQ